MTQLTQTGATTTKFHVCELCETGCGLAVDLQDGRVTGIRGNDADVFSRGYTSPKGLASLALDADPDRLRTPVRRAPDGSFHPIGWDEAFSHVAERLQAVQRAHGRDAVAVYMGTPVVHKHGALLMRGALLGALRTKNSTSAGSQDTSPRFAASYLMYGSTLSIPVPDVDRTAFFLCIGGNPLVSNGSLLTAPNMRARLRAIQARGGTVVVVDPRRTETADVASEHVAILPGGDVAFLLAMAHVIVHRGRFDRRFIAQKTRGFDAVAERLREWTPERAEPLCGVDAATIRRLALAFADAPSSVAYTRLGVCNSATGTIASYAADLLNVVAGRLGAIGGAIFPKPAIDLPRLARLVGTDGFGRWKSRVRGLPETAGDVPASVLAEEIETPGEGQVRAFITFAGNPVLSTPNGPRLARALATLDFMVSIDLYVNETTRFADVILPPAGPLADDHLDLFFANAATRNVIRWLEPVTPRTDDEREDWEILLELAYRLGGGPSGIRGLDWVLGHARRFGLHVTPSTVADFAMRIGPYGDHFVPGVRGLNGRKVRATPEGIDLGAVEAGIEHRVFHQDGRVDLAPPLLMAALDEYAQASRGVPAPELLLIGRRDMRSNNSWMHNLPKLAAGRDRCVLLVHPEDAARHGLVDGAVAILESRVHSGEVPVRISDEVRPGVVSLPHGFGHATAAPWQKVAGARPGVSANDWTDDQAVEAVVGQSILNGVPVRIRAARP
jgi:anaerobic selenocysteine-containing dehydrogenase